MESNKKIGDRVKALRESKNLSIEEVAERSGLNKEQIERIESKQFFPSLSPLIKIARVLGVRLGTFLDDETELGPVITRRQESAGKNSIRFAGDSNVTREHMEYYSLSQDKSSRHMEPFLIDIRSEKGAPHDLSSHEGEEFIYVLEGHIEINYGKDTYVLETGDSIYYDSIVAHNVHAAGEGSAKILGIVYTPF
ncbi:MAG: XRE family transcriptional regulator [Bacteroidales bacterium]|jgi:transcriptional regulator with XRE-family HTH domain|nr:XRE family transcriptional regulator [Bacteroidales bacterium]